jgi:hypothetical protein
MPHGVKLECCVPPPKTEADAVPAAAIVHHAAVAVPSLFLALTHEELKAPLLDLLDKVRRQTRAASSARQRR